MSDTFFLAMVVVIMKTSCSIYPVRLSNPKDGSLTGYDGQPTWGPQTSRGPQKLCVDYVLELQIKTKADPA